MTDKLPGSKFILFSLVCLLAAAYIASVSGNFTRLPFFDSVNVYEAVLDEASNVAVGDDVRIAGVDVGRVNSIALEQGRAVITFEVDEDVVPTTTWQSGARWRNVIGQRFLYLYPNPGGTPLVSRDLGVDGDGRIPVEQSVQVADLAAFVQNVTPLLEALDPVNQNKVINALNDTLVGRDQTVQSLVTNLSELAGTVSEQEPEIRSVITNANLLLGEYNARDDQLVGLIDQLSSVGGTLANRNGEILDAAVDLAEVQRQLGELIAANDEGLLDTATNLHRITDSIGMQRGAFEDSIASLRQGLAVYMLTSRQGEWFNVRAVAIQVQNGGAIVSCVTEGGTQCAFPNSPQSPGAQTPTAAAAPADGEDAALQLAPERLNAFQVVTGVPLIRDDEVAASGGATR
ncbi:MlaD family protein [soil metagenome]